MFTILSLLPFSIQDLVPLLLLIAAVAVPSAAEVAAKWARRAASATPEYEAGVRSPSVSWSAATKASEDIYKAAVAQAAAEGRFGKGVTAAGDQEWQQGAIEKGTQRWAPGIAMAEGDMQQGIGKVLSVIASVTLPPRRVKGDPGNIERVRVIAQALNKAFK